MGTFGDMDPEAFRREAHRIADWIADYLADPGRYPVLSRSRPFEIRDALPPAAPEHGESFDDIFADFERVLLPGITHWNHPGFFAYFAISGSAPGVLGEFLSAALNVQAMLWRTSPAATELEDVVLTWLRRLLGLPDSFEGVIYDTASVSTLHALAAARERAVADVRTRGRAGRFDLPPLRIYCSEHAHSSVDKACRLLGLDVRKVPADDAFRLRPDALDLTGACAVVATVGTTSSTSVDPLVPVAEACERHGAWLHVDAAYAGSAMVCPEHRWAFEGVERVDSLVVNPHKWMLTAQGCSALWTRRPDDLRAAFSLVPEYLRTPDEVVSFSEYGPALGRPFRALQLWAVLRCFGREGLQAAIRNAVSLAEAFEGWVRDEDGWELCAPRPFSVVCFRREGTDEDNAALLERVNARGEVFLSHTKLDGRYVLRLAVGNVRSTMDDVRRAWDVLREEAA